MGYSWNITSEIQRREHGFSNRWELRARNSNTFDQSFLGSLFMAQQIKATHTVGEMYNNPRSLDFNLRGDLLCVGYDDKKIAIYDWTSNEVKFCFNSEHIYDPNDVKLINIDTSLNVISTSTDGEIRRAWISPMGDVISTRLYNNAHTKARPKLAQVPRNLYEFVGVNTVGNIFLMDLRCSQAVCSTDAYVRYGTGSPLPLYDVAYHPFASEFCVGGCDAFVRVYDRRNLSACVQKMYPENLTNIMEILQCSYNYNGSEILANYVEEGAYLFNTRSYTPGDYLSKYERGSETFDEARFFGPKSEFVICAETEGICFFHKKTGKSVKCESPPSDLDDGSISYFSILSFVCGVKSHPFLPVIASKTCKRGVIVWAPKNT